MGETVASRSKEILDYLVDKNKKAYELVQGNVNEWVLAHEKIEKLLNTKSNSVRVMKNMERIRNVAYSIEDALQNCADLAEIHYKKKRGIRGFFRGYFGSNSMEYGEFLTIVTLMLKILLGDSIEWLHKTFPEEEDLGSDDKDWRMANQRGLRWPEHINVYGMEENLVEMQDDFNNLTSLVAERKVVSIWGVKGLGKTTLARRVYIDDDVRSGFDALAWVSLQQGYRIGSVLQSMLSQLGTEAVKKSAEDSQSNQNMKKLGAGSVKKSAVEKKDAAGEQEKVADVKKKAAEGQTKGVEEKIDGAEEKENEVEQKQVAKEKKSSKEKIQVTEEKKKAEKRKEDAEGKKLGAENQKKWAHGQERGVEEQENGAEEKKEGENNLIFGILIQNMRKLVAVMKTRADEQKNVAEEIEEVGAQQQISTEEKMIVQLKKILKQKTCLIVIDGISELSQWTDISSELLKEDTNTKFLLTTDDKTTADVADYCFKLRPLSENEGWNLLQKYVFKGKAPDLGLVPKLGKEMVNKCGGLPSKICSLGRALSAKTLSFSEWHKVNDNFIRQLETDHQSESNEGPSGVVYPSNDHLPYWQMQRFLYLAIFKENEVIDPDDLSFLWMAEGMLSPQQEDKERRLMVAAEDYLRDLADRRLLHLQVDELSANRKFIPLSLHNNARKLALYLGQEAQLGLKVLDFCGGKQPRFDPYSLHDETRRLVIHFNKLSSGTRTDLFATCYLRSLLFLNSDWEYVCLPVRISDFKEFTLLRVLHFVRCKFEGRKLPEGIWKLLYLRYFGVLYCDLDELPPSISNFTNLQVLNVRSYDDAKIAISEVINKMVKLKCLRLPRNSDCKLKLEELVDLETLVGFDVDKHGLDDVSKLEKLQYVATHASSNKSLESIVKKFHGSDIRINLLIDYKCDFISIEGLPVLEEVLMCPNIEALTISMVRMDNFPNCGAFASSNLTQVKLIGCKLNADPMEALMNFPNLRKLCFGYGSFVGSLMAISGEGFPKLEYLEFCCLPNLEEWTVDKGALQNLSALTVKRCPNLKRIPQELGSVSSLTNLDVEFPPSVCDEEIEKYRQMFTSVNSRIRYTSDGFKLIHS